MYELTHHEDEHDLRYRLKDKICIASDSKASDRKRVVALAPSSTVAQDDVDGKRDTAVSENKGKDERGSSTDTDSFLLVTCNHIILCEGPIVQLYDFAGNKVISGEHCLAKNQSTT